MFLKNFVYLFIYLFLVTAKLLSREGRNILIALLVVVGILFGITLKIIKWCFLKD